MFNIHCHILYRPMGYNTPTNHDLAQVEISLNNNLKWIGHFPFLFINRLKITWERRAYLWSDLGLRFVSFYTSNYIPENNGCLMTIKALQKKRYLEPVILFGVH